MQAHEKVGFYMVQLMRSSFDLFTGYKPSKQMSEERWLQRILFLETVAGERCSSYGSWRLSQACSGCQVESTTACKVPRSVQLQPGQPLLEAATGEGRQQHTQRLRLVGRGSKAH